MTKNNNNKVSEYFFKNSKEVILKMIKYNDKFLKVVIENSARIRTYYYKNMDLIKAAIFGYFKKADYFFIRIGADIELICCDWERFKTNYINNDYLIFISELNFTNLDEFLTMYQEIHINLYKEVEELIYYLNTL